MSELPQATSADIRVREYHVEYDRDGDVARVALTLAADGQEWIVQGGVQGRSLALAPTDAPDEVVEAARLEFEDRGFATVVSGGDFGGEVAGNV